MGATRMKKIKRYLLNLVLPVFYYGAVTGILTAAIVTLYKWCAMHVIAFSMDAYAYLREHLYWLAAIVPALFGVAVLLYLIYKKWPNLRGGGIPTSVGILRGLITFKWLRNLLGVFVLSMCSFLLGVPLGNEGPSVQMGTAIGAATLAPMRKNQKAWGRYAMTGGACVGFATATGAPICGIIFAVEEAHERISPIILLVATVSVVFGKITSDLLSPLLGVSTSLFTPMSLETMGLGSVWIPVVVGLIVGVFAVLYLSYHKLIRRIVNKTLGKIKSFYKIFAVLLLTLALGLVSTNFISTGHGLIEELLDGNVALYMIIIALFVRATMTLFANSSGVTGGIFLPTLAIGASIAAILGEVLMMLGLGQEYYSFVLVLGITACIASMMKMPITAIVFAVEALSCYNNILHVIVVVAIAFAITEIFRVKSINDKVLENHVEEQSAGKTRKVLEGFVTVQNDAFAIGKQVRDILWPSNLFVLSITRNPDAEAEVDEHGGKTLHAGDVLHVRYVTYDQPTTNAEIMAIVGEQEINAQETAVV